MIKNSIIVNPISGRGNGAKLSPLIETYLTKLSLDFDLHHTEYPRHAIQLAEQAVTDGYDVVVAVGGDGTANEVLNGLLQATQMGSYDCAIGLIPVGRGNDFAFGAQIPPALEVACTTIARGKRRWIDVGFVQGGDYPQGRYFGNGIGIGFDAVVGFEALKLKRLHGFPSYIVAALKTISLYFNAPTLQIEFNGTTLTQPSLLVSVMNGRRMGGGFMMAPNGRMDDGLFDLCIARQVSRAGILRLIPRFMKGNQAGHPAIRTDLAAHVTVTALKGSLPAHADGETLCVAGKRLEARIVPHALQIMVP